QQSLMETLRRAIVAFNDYGEEQLPDLRHRMTLITTVPVLQGHSMLRYAEWCDVIAAHVASRLGTDPEDQVPQVIANRCLGTAMASYRYWTRHPQVALLQALDAGLRLLAAGFDGRSLVLPALGRGGRASGESTSPAAPSASAERGPETPPGRG